MQNQDISLKNIEIDYEQKLGSGYIATVYLGKHKFTQKNYAIKIVKWGEVEENERKILMREIKIHQTLDHPNIVKMYSHEILDDHLYIILEYLPKGTLFKKVQRERLTDLEICDILIGLFDALSYMHDKQIVHRDIKPENIIQDDKGVFKLCDFGFSANFGIIDGRLQKRNTFCGTQQYFAPEILNNKEQDEKVDIWTMGVLLYELSHKRAPFLTDSFARRETISKTFLIKPTLNSTLEKITRMCLKKNPRDRPSAKEVLSMIQQLKDNLTKNRETNLNIVVEKVDKQESPSTFQQSKFDYSLHSPQQVSNCRFIDSNVRSTQFTLLSSIEDPLTKSYNRNSYLEKQQNLFLSSLTEQQIPLIPQQPNPIVKRVIIKQAQNIQNQNHIRIIRSISPTPRRFLQLNVSVENKQYMYNNSQFHKNSNSYYQNMKPLQSSYEKKEIRTFPSSKPNQIQQFQIRKCNLFYIISIFFQ